MPLKWNGLFLACCLGVSALLASPAAEAARKYNPGHYVALLRSQDSHAYMAASLKPGVKGLMKRYSWKSLEPTPGDYNFSEIQSDLHWAAAYGVRLVVMIEDKTFVAERPRPAYLDSYTRRNRKGGYTLLRWNAVRRRPHATLFTRARAASTGTGPSKASPRRNPRSASTNRC